MKGSRSGLVKTHSTKAENPTPRTKEKPIEQKNTDEELSQCFEDSLIVEIEEVLEEKVTICQNLLSDNDYIVLNESKTEEESVPGSSIKLLFWNVSGIRSLDDETWDYIKQFDVVNLVETWMEKKKWFSFKKQLPQEFVWKSQFAQRMNESGRAIGGILTGIKQHIKEEQDAKIVKTTHGILDRQLIIGRNRWKIITVYNRENVVDIKKTINKRIQTAVENNQRILIVGDFNARIGEETTSGRKSMDKTVNWNGKHLLKWIEESELKLLNGSRNGDVDGEFTFIGKKSSSVIDYGVVEQISDDQILNFSIDHMKGSDHLPLIIEIKIEEEIEE